jgi:hypothetical protein
MVEDIESGPIDTEPIMTRLSEPQKVKIDILTKALRNAEAAQSSIYLAFEWFEIVEPTLDLSETLTAIDKMVETLSYRLSL